MKGRQGKGRKSAGAQCRHALCILLLAALGWPLAARGSDPSGGAAGAFLRLGMDARPLGLGGACTAAAGDASAAYWNPAGLAAVGRPEVSGTYTALAGSGEYSQFGCALPLSLFGFPADERAGSLGTGPAGTVAFSLLHFAAAYDIEARRIDSLNPNYLFSDVEGCYSLAFGLPLGSGWAAGINVKGLYHFLDQQQAGGWGIDAGGRWQPFPGLQLGLAVRNAYARLQWNTGQGETFPPSATLAAAYGWRLGEVHGLLVSAEAEQALPDGRIKLRAGAEYNWSQLLFVRGGYTDGRPALGAGARLPWIGWGRAGLGLDYAAVQDPILDWDHWFTLKLEL